MRIAQRHISDLSKIRPLVPAENRVLSHPRLRRIARRLACERERLVLALEGSRRAARTPHHFLGRFLMRFRLMRQGLVSRQLQAALAVFVAVAVWRFVADPAADSVGGVLSGALFGAALVGVIASVWSEFGRSPLAARRIRRRIARNPECVLATTSPHRQAELTARDEETPIVPRDDLYDEVLPGILDRRRGDIQMVVGEPGAGKTTALVGLAERLARMGFVPVVVPMWGDMPGDLVEAAEKRFKRHAANLVRSARHLDDVWCWLRDRRRIVVAVDDVDRIAPDGERGFMLRRGLQELAAENLPTVVTTRPAGIPAGLAASAINLDQLDPEAAVDHVLRVAWAEPGATAKGPPSAKVRGNVERWVREGRFAEVPFYLELLARLVAVGQCDELPPARAVVSERGDTGRAREREGGRCEWNPQWVRFLLLEHFYQEVGEGRVHQWLAIEARERKSCLTALSEVALATLAATAMRARTGAQHRQGSSERPRIRVEIQDFLESDDRAQFTDGGLRRTVSAHEVVDTGERLRILDRDPDGKLHFHHRIMQAYFAGRCLADRGVSPPSRRRRDWMKVRPPDWIGALLDPCHPERLTAQMTLTFAALRASALEEAASGARKPGPPDLVKTVLDRLIGEAKESLPGTASVSPGSGNAVAEDDKRLDPREPFHPEANRADPDDALAKLTTAAEIARATHAERRTVRRIVAAAREATGATMWTKLHAIPSLAALRSSTRWHCMWEFARDPDQEVRRAASEAIADDALAAYHTLRRPIEQLLARTALRSAYGQSLDSPGMPAVDGDGAAPNRAVQRAAAGSDGELWDAADGVPAGDPKDDALALRALGWVLPAMVSGLREHGEESSPDASAAREALEQFVTLAFQGGQAELEASLAQGFKSDAMRHASDTDGGSGPGLVANNRRLVADLCIDHADYWYARLVLHQALALYTIAGSNRKVTLDVYGRLLRRGCEPHPFVWRAAHLARRAVVRQAIGSDRWTSLIWVDEGVAVSRRSSEMSPAAAQLVGDVTLLLNLRERAPEDRQAHFPRMRELPHCLHGSPDRREVLGAGCPPSCGYGLCPLKQPPPDEPNGQRTVSRAFCRAQYELASHRKPPWQKKHIRKRDLQEFWRQMERRART